MVKPWSNAYFHACAMQTPGAKRTFKMYPLRSLWTKTKVRLGADWKHFFEPTLKTPLAENAEYHKILNSKCTVILLPITKSIQISTFTNIFRIWKKKISKNSALGPRWNCLHIFTARQRLRVHQTFSPARLIHIAQAVPEIFHMWSDSFEMAQKGIANLLAQHVYASEPLI